MKKLLSTYGCILCMIILVVLLGTSCSESGKRVYTPAPKDSIITLRAMSMTDSIIAPIKVRSEDNVYRLGDKVWVWAKNPDSLEIRVPSGEIPLAASVISHGSYRKYKLLSVKQ